MKEREIWKDYSRAEKVSYSIYVILITTLLFGIIYWGYLSDEALRIGETIGVSYLILIVLGILKASIITETILNNLFFPESKNETETKKKINEKKKHYKKKYPLRIAHMKIDILDKQVYIKRRELQISNLNKKIENWEKSK